MVEPMPYVRFMSLVAGARAVITDSGGVQEETTYLGIPCFTLRDTTERPITVTEGTNLVVGTDPARILAELEAILATGGKSGRVPALWDGHAGERAAAAIGQRWS